MTRPATVTPRIAALIAQIAQLTQQAGVTDMIVALRDPQSNAVEIVSTQTGRVNLRAALAQKFDLQDPMDAAAEAAWPD